GLKSAFRLIYLEDAAESSDEQIEVVSRVINHHQLLLWLLFGNLAHRLLLGLAKNGTFTHLVPLTT
ncbi:MAG: hypothetical protein ACFCBU_18280, partial [Cyanophyceae cyanobacterium]